MKQKEHTLPLLADRLNHEPVVALGCTTSEVMSITGCCAAVGAGIGVPTGLLLGSAFGASAGLFIGFGLFFLCSMLGTYLLLMKLQRHKESHGNQYYKEKLHCWLSSLGLAKSSVHQVSQRYIRGRKL